VISIVTAASRADLLGATIDWWPKQLELLASLDGPERLHVWSIGRQAGKSSLAAVAAVANCALRSDLDAMVPRGRVRYVLVAAPAEDQAREFIRLCAAVVDGSEALRSMATVKADRIDFRMESGALSAIRAMPANSRSVRGLSASLIVLDEFAHFTDTAGPASDERMFAALEPSTRVFRDLARVLVISTPFGETGKFYELFQAAASGVLPSARAVHAPVWDVDTSLDEAWRDARRAELGEDVFCQELGADFVASGGQFFDLGGVEFEDGPAPPEAGRNWVAGLDPAFHADHFGAALVGESIAEPGVLLVGGCPLTAAEEGEQWRRGVYYGLEQQQEEPAAAAIEAADPSRAMNLRVLERMRVLNRPDSAYQRTAEELMAEDEGRTQVKTLDSALVSRAPSPPARKILEEINAQKPDDLNEAVRLLAQHPAQASNPRGVARGVRARRRAGQLS
jgi:hypothetical protein